MAKPLSIPVTPSYLEHCYLIYQGMVDPGENRTATLIREFGEEACNSLEASAEQKAKITQLLTELFSSGDTVSSSRKVKRFFLPTSHASVKVMYQSFLI